MHDVSEGVWEEFSENEDDIPERLFVTESGLLVPTPLRTLSMSSMAQQQATQVLGEDTLRCLRGGGVVRRRTDSNASSEAYDVTGEHGPGNPLFPTKFAKLAIPA
jgi:hypothetical protein